jgi:hypothetical protein
MWFKNIFILILVSLFISEFTFAQVPAKKDSTQIYKNIQSYSSKGKFTKFLYRLVFKPVATETPKKKSKKKIYKKLILKPYSAFEGKTIRHINIETLDPFGYSITDTVVVHQNFLYRTGNMLHIKSQHIAIRNLLLIHQNQKFDSLLVKESERLVRSRGYITDVSFSVRILSKNSDSVDIFIREIDKWSIIPKIESSLVSTTINLTDENFLGVGHEFQNSFNWQNTPGEYVYSTNYFIPNISNTYVNVNLHYGKDEFRNFTKSFDVSRPFFSPFAKWAAGVNFTQQFRKDSILTTDFKYKFNSQDYWAGYAIQIFKGNTENKRTTNLISAARFFRIRYLEKPFEALDSLHNYSNENLYLASIGISTRKYVQDKFIFNYGVIEDVPIGKVYSITGGYQERENTGRLYLGARISTGYYYPWGYLSTNFEYGTFFQASHAQQGVFSVSANYFTGLLEIGRWKLRQFVKPQLMIGFNRLSYDSLTLNEGYGLDGFNSSVLSGTKRLLFTLQTQSYAPWNFIGFRFGPFLIYSAGILGNSSTGFKNSKVYSQFGFGVLIKNEYMVLNTFQISIAFYPLIPGNGQDIFEINSFKTTDFGFKDFEIGKPAIVIYQ